jgi:hypothetical protein
LVVKKKSCLVAGATETSSEFQWHTFRHRGSHRTTHRGSGSYSMFLQLPCCCAVSCFPIVTTVTAFIMRAQ